MTDPIRKALLASTTLAVVLILGIGCAEGGFQNFHERELRLSMAGRGDPWSHMTQDSKLVLLALHEGLSKEGIQNAVGMDREALEAEFDRLEAVGLLRVQEDRYFPDFFIANRAEAAAAYAHSRETGIFLAQEALTRWEDLEAAFAGLVISTDHSLHDLGFFLVGGRILDMGMLAALVEEGSLLDHAPARPSPERPDGRYYFWGVEGDPDLLGRYGENTTSLGDTKWSFATFGANYLDGKPNGPRNEMEDRFNKLLEANPEGSPTFFSQEFCLPFLTLEDSGLWAQTSENLSRVLVTRLLEAGPDIPSFFRTLGAGDYAPDRLPEFVIWYYHLTYAWAIDHLIEEGVIARPPDEFLAMVLYLEDEGGVLKGF